MKTKIYFTYVIVIILTIMILIGALSFTMIKIKHTKNHASIKHIVSQLEIRNDKSLLKLKNIKLNYINQKSNMLFVLTFVISIIVFFLIILVVSEFECFASSDLHLSDKQSIAKLLRWNYLFLLLFASLGMIILFLSLMQNTNCKNQIQNTLISSCINDFNKSRDEITKNINQVIILGNICILTLYITFSYFLFQCLVLRKYCKKIIQR